MKLKWKMAIRILREEVLYWDYQEIAQIRAKKEEIPLWASLDSILKQKPEIGILLKILFKASTDKNHQNKLTLLMKLRKIKAKIQALARIISKEKNKGVRKDFLLKVGYLIFKSIIVTQS